MSSSKHSKHDVVRVDDVRVRIDHPDGVPMTLFASEDVPIEGEAIAQAVDFARLAGTLDDLGSRERRGAIAPHAGRRHGRARGHRAKGRAPVAAAHGQGVTST